MRINYYHSSPCPILSDSIELYWMAEHPSGTTDQRTVSILPDGHIELVVHIDLDKPPVIKTCKNSIDSEMSYVIGMTTGPVSVKLPNKGKVIGIRFKPFGAYSFLCHSMNELRNRVVSLEHILGNRARELSGVIESAVRKKQSLSDALSNYFIRAINPRSPREARFIQSTFPVFHNKHVAKISEITNPLKLGVRQLERDFKEYIGMSPKQYLKLRQLQFAVRELSSQSHNSITQVALNSGFYDHSQFCHDFRRFAGIPPSQYTSTSLFHH